jgi:hypothetical protein
MKVDRSLGVNFSHTSPTSNTLFSEANARKAKLSSSEEQFKKTCRRSIADDSLVVKTRISLKKVCLVQWNQ